jgi:hypothetical protein
VEQGGDAERMSEQRAGQLMRAIMEKKTFVGERIGLTSGGYQRNNNNNIGYAIVDGQLLIDADARHLGPLDGGCSFSRSLCLLCKRTHRDMGRMGR